MSDMKLFIKNEALKSFALKGYEGTSVREIAKLVGLTPSALYAHFTSKEALYLDILDSCIYNFVKGLEDVFNKYRYDIKERVLYYVYIYFVQFYMNASPDSIFIQRNTMFPPAGLQDIIIAKFINQTKEMHCNIEKAFSECFLTKEVPVVDYIITFFRLLDGFIMDVVARKKVYKLEELDIQWNTYWRLIQEL